MGISMLLHPHMVVPFMAAVDKARRIRSRCSPAAAGEADRSVLGAPHRRGVAFPCSSRNFWCPRFWKYVLHVTWRLEYARAPLMKMQRSDEMNNDEEQRKE
jgi:hypothetical protein